MKKTKQTAGDKYVEYLARVFGHVQELSSARQSTHFSPVEQELL